MYEKDKFEGAFKVVNVVASASLGQRINLNAIIEAFSNARFPSERFPGVVFKTKRPRTSTLIFSSGNIVCAGGKSEAKARKAVQIVVRKLSKERIIIPKETKVKINNIVVSGKLMQKVDIDLLSQLHGAMYEPELFPALIYRLDKPKVVFLIFPSGKVVCAGSKSESEVKQAFKNLTRRLKTLTFKVAPEQRFFEDIETKRIEVTLHKFNLKDFASSETQGKACNYISGLWCINKSCEGPPCKFANLIQKKLINGLYGCWGFHWHEGLYAPQTKRLQRKFNN